MLVIIDSETYLIDRNQNQYKIKNLLSLTMYNDLKVLDNEKVNENNFLAIWETIVITIITFNFSFSEIYVYRNMLNCYGPEYGPSTFPYIFIWSKSAFQMLSRKLSLRESKTMWECEAIKRVFLWSSQKLPTANIWLH